jgi:hypothetical protein
MKVDIQPTGLIVRAYKDPDATPMVDPYDAVFSIQVLEEEAFVFGYHGVGLDREARLQLAEYLRSIGVTKARWKTLAGTERGSTDR